jgi:hypothetical protein
MFLVVKWEISTGGERCGRAGAREGGKEREKKDAWFLIQNESQMASLTCLSVLVFKIFFQLCYSIDFFYGVKKQEKNMFGIVIIIIF